MIFDAKGFSKWLVRRGANSTYPATLKGMADFYNWDLDQMSSTEVSVAITQISRDNERILAETNLSKKDFNQIYQSRTSAFQDYQRYRNWRDNENKI